MSKNEKGFYLFFDWIEEMEELKSPEDAWRIVLALRDYALNGTDPTQFFSGAYKAFIRNIYNQIKRAELKAEIGRESIKKRWNNHETADAPNSNLIGANSNLIGANTTNTYTNTDTDTVTENNNNNNIVYNSACAQEEQQNVESFPHVEMEIMRYFAKEHFESNAEDFIAYNKARNWKGFGGEDVREDYSRYADRWEEEHLRRIGFKT